MQPNLETLVKMYDPSTLDRFWSKVDKSGPCWLWTKHKDKDGYGIFWFNGKNVRAHRFILSVHLGRVIDEKCSLHTCDTPACVTLAPLHLFEGTTGENNTDRHLKDRDAVGEINGNSKLTAVQVNYVLNSDLPTQALANILKVSYQHIWRIRLRMNWFSTRSKLVIST